MMRVGFVTDLAGYRDYCDRFSRESTEKIVEIHLLESDLKDGFHERLKELQTFVRERGIREISFHSIDRIMQSVLYEEEGFEQDLPGYELLLEGVKRFSEGLDHEVLLVVHQGSKYPRKRNEALGVQGMVELRAELSRKCLVGLAKIRRDVQGSGVKIALENSPPTCASDDNDHVFDLCFEDFQERLGEDELFVFDFSHAAMCVEYFKQDEVYFPALEALRDEEGRPPFSLRSLENYVELAGKNMCWMHINDATGVLGEHEGKKVGVEGSVIDYPSVLSRVEAFVDDPRGILEIVDSHKDYGLISESLVNLKAFWAQRPR